MQLTETVTIINKSGKVISNGKHIVNVFKEAKAAYQDKKANLKAERAATSETRPGIRKTQTYAGPSNPGYYGTGHEGDDRVYELPERRTQHLLHDEPHSLDKADRRRSGDDTQSHASSRRSHGSHRSKKTRDKSGGKDSRPPLTLDNLRTLSEVSSTTPSQVPLAYRSAYAETATRDNNNNLMLTRPNLVHAPTAPAAVDLRRKDVDMNLAYGDIPPDLESRTDLGPAAQLEGEREREAEAEVHKEAEARTLMERIEALLDEAECFHHTATSIIDHLQRKPEAAAAVALLLAELSTVLKAISPGFLGVVKGGFPAIFALLASPQFLVGVGVAVGVTVVCFGGWKIVKQIREAKAAKEKEAFEMQGRQPAAAATADMSVPASAPSVDGQSVYDDALVLEEELSSIEMWRRGIAPAEEGAVATVMEHADLELITPKAARSVRDDGRSIRTTKSHRSSKSHSGHKSRRHEDGGDKDGDVDAPRRKSSKSKAADAESVAGSERSRRSSRSKTTRSTTKALTDGGDQEENTLDMVLRPKDKKPNMLKTMFMRKKDKDDGRGSAVSVMS